MLQRLERLAEASEAASKSFEVASEQFEKACAMAQLDLPPAIESIERTSKEFEELALHLRIMTGGKRKPSPPKTPPDPAGERAHAAPAHAFSTCLNLPKFAGIFDTSSKISLLCPKFAFHTARSLG